VDRRAFIGTVAGALLAAPLATGAQQPGKMYMVGALSVGFNDDPAHDWWQPFLDAMGELGYVEFPARLVGRPWHAVSPVPARELFESEVLRRVRHPAGSDLLKLRYPALIDR
jgi:hypothetical protein